MQYEINTEINEIVAEVLESYTVSVKTSQARHLVQLMHKHFKFFKTSFINLVDRILVLEEKDHLIKNVYSLISKFFAELSKT